MGDRGATLLGRATFAWQSDYGQFYLIDGDGDNFQAPVEITPEMEKRGLLELDTGLVVYTNGCLQQHLRIDLYDREPAHPAVEAMTGAPWTRVATANLRFPSRSFRVSSPSSPDPLPGGPVFFVDAEAMAAWVAWKEFQGSRDDSVPVEPDVIEVIQWPQM